jgi:tellurium resistance protein TerD
MGDNRTGAGDGDDEQIYIDFTKIPANIHKLAVVVTIHEAKERKQNFGMVDNAFIHLTALQNADDENGEDLLRFDLTEDYSTETALLIAEIYRHNGEWKFGAKGDGFKDGLAGFVRMYGGQC